MKLCLRPAFLKPSSAREVKQSKASDKLGLIEIAEPTPPRVALLTGGGDKHYAFGLTFALASKGVLIDFIGSDGLEGPTIQSNPRIKFLNLRGNQDPNVNLAQKVRRITAYYLRLLWFAANSKSAVFHILWNNKVEVFDRTIVLLYYKLCGRRIVFTAHNVNAAKRDAMDSWVNRVTLYLQYCLVDHIFVHTGKMRDELQTEFEVNPNKITIIPYGINNAVPDTGLPESEAKRQLGIENTDFAVLFFGQIAPYKGLEYLIAAFVELLKGDSRYRLIIAGKPKWDEVYWDRMKNLIQDAGVAAHVVQRIEFIPDAEAELFFKAADVLVLPYTDIFQSGILFLGYSFGLPAIVSDVGALKDDVADGETGFICKPRDAADLVNHLRRYFASDLFRELAHRRAEIKAYVTERHSWDTVANLTTEVYEKVAEK